MLNVKAGVVDTVKLSSVTTIVPSFKNIEQHDSIAKTDPFASLAELLTDQSLVQVNNEGGKGALKTISIRGLTSSHTNVTWNNININSLTFGAQNLGGMSAGLYDEVALINGNGASSLNSVSIGGTLILGNKLNWNKPFSVSVGSEVGSFGFIANQTQLSLSKKNWVGEVRLIEQRADNDYEYINPKKIGKPTEEQEHAAFSNTNLLFSLGYRNKKRNFILANHSWIGTNYSEIPKTYNVNSPSTALSSDSVLRSVFVLKGIYKDLAYELTSGINHQRYLYSDVSNDINTYYRLNNIQSNLTVKYKFKQYKFQSFIEYQNQLALNNQYDQKATRNIGLYKLNVEKKSFKKRLKTFGTFIVNQVNESDFIPVGLLGYNLDLKGINLKGGLGNHFRLPAFNDLFWPNGGNSELNPELGWSTEQSINYSKRIKSFDLKVGGETYYSIVSNWIQWKVAGSSAHVENVKKVNAFGGSGFVAMGYNVKGLRLNMESHYGYTRTITLESDIPNDAWIGKQNIYIPIHKNLNKFKASFKGYTAVAEMNYFGRRYLSADNIISQSIEPYPIFNFRLNKMWEKGGKKLQSRFSILNINNLSYQGVTNRPMPGRAYYLTFILNFN